MSTCDPQTVYARVVQLALRDSLHYNVVRSVWRTADGIFLIRSEHIPEPGDQLLGQTCRYVVNPTDAGLPAARWVYEPRVSADQVEATQPAAAQPAEPLVIFTEDRRGFELRDRGTWKRLTLRTENGQGAFSATIKCPKCGQFGTLEDHRIHVDGRVWPSLVCPSEKCDFHGWAQLEGWSEES